MKYNIKKSNVPIYVTRPLLPKIEDFEKEVRAIFHSQWLTNMGKKHNTLEKKLTKILKTPHSLLFNNGTIGLMVALKALNLPEKSEVITSPFTFAATPHCISWNGLTPVFADIEADTMTIDTASIVRCITPKTSAILGVHIYGFPCHVDQISRIAFDYNLKVVYDAAHAFSTEIDGKGIGTFGNITMFSFHATKLFNSIEGGCLTFNDASLVKTIRNLRNFGIQSEEMVDEVGINGKMNEIQAALGLLNLKKFEKEKKKRASIKNMYTQAFSEISGIRIPEMPSNATSSYQYYPVIIEDNYPISRDELYLKLKKYNIMTRKYFYPLCSDYACYGEHNLRNNEKLSNANKLKNQVLCLPFYGDLEKSVINTIIGIFIKFSQ